MIGEDAAQHQRGPLAPQPVGWHLRCMMACTGFRDGRQVTLP